jgi:hypothetical protein
MVGLSLGTYVLHTTTYIGKVRNVHESKLYRYTYVSNGKNKGNAKYKFLLIQSVVEIINVKLLRVHQAIY